MKYPEKIYKTVKEYYENMANVRKLKQSNRISEVHEKIPQIAEADREISMLAVKFTRSLAAGSDAVENVKIFREECDRINAFKKELLLKNGYSEDYLDEEISCTLCNDAGFYDGKMCQCFENRIIEEIRKNSNLPLVMDKQSFDTFNLNYYSDEGNPSPRLIMGAVKSMCEDYAQNFSDESPNLLFYGGTGLGKTFLSSCIAKKVMDKGASVFYQSAYKIFSMFDKIKFDDEKDELVKFHTDNAYDVDLLVIDDLGTEFITSYTAEVLFDLINTRFNSGKKTIINTNLGPEELEKIYSARITSRLFGDYMPIEFYGNDIRRIKQSENL
ncbi:MAG: ATP-binding protein [Clostridia bacterium]|nr:ATP-binding protein [Clostridia bacterium]